MFDVIYKRVPDVWRRKYVDSRPEDVSVPETAQPKILDMSLFQCSLYLMCSYFTAIIQNTLEQ